MTYRFLLHHLVTEAAEQRPDAVAVVDRDRSLTYGELDERSARLAAVLAERGVGVGARVGLYLDKSLEAVIGVYAVLRSGAAYVPIDPRSPPARSAYILRDCEVTTLLTGRARSGTWSDLLAEGAPLQHLLVLDGLPDALPPLGIVEVLDATAASHAAAPISTRRHESSDLDLAYILYTSGSTGRPKGVMLTHRNALAFVHWAREEVQVGPDDRLSSHAPFHFDLSVFDLYVTASAGARVCLLPSAASVFPVEIARFIDEQRITVWYSVPSILTMLAEHGNLEPGALETLRTVVFAGEVFPSKYLVKLMGLLPHASFYNWYGPTETNVCTSYRVPAPPEAGVGDIPIGRSIDGVDTFVVGNDDVVVASGEVGELLVRGSTVMRGYWGDPEKTASRLVTDPRPDALGDPVYRTGDLVSELPGGDYRFHGRVDNQIKSRGYRIELGEIEAAVNAHPSVIECAAVAVPDELISNRIKVVAVVATEIAGSELAAFCATRVPRYMVPDQFELRLALPRTSTGKIDRVALAASDG
ncbi:MAG: amino acid adenylation domain-containing protein [Acidimicrobiales bacterium]